MFSSDVPTGDAVEATHKATVLLVDDHALMRMGVANIINQEPDLQVVAEAANGAEAIAAFEQFRPDVRLVDLRMPIMEGVEAVRQIRARDPRARVIARRPTTPTMRFHAP
jgi:two-component system NarL family response regulator